MICLFSGIIEGSDVLPFRPAVELTHLVVKWSAVRNQSEIANSIIMRGMFPFLFVKLVQQRRTQNHAKPAHRVRRSSGQPFAGTTRSAGVGGFGLALAILVGLAKNGVAPHSFIFPVNHFSRPKAEARLPSRSGKMEFCCRKAFHW